MKTMKKPLLRLPYLKYMSAAFCIAALTIFCSGWKKADKKAAAKKPNIIFILTDDMGFGDIACFGGKFVPTPHIDKIAQNGRKLMQYYSAAPICSPSRCGLITGMYPAPVEFFNLPGNPRKKPRSRTGRFSGSVSAIYRPYI